ncbi:MAG: UDP-N-acetylmuramate--L-alanine ligase [Candidatus Omnitrophica bacterium]|nr:UDP-N-acetylmuramate--L-alanine ligase [Candidatus Omnitrophota bacterium]
MKKHYHFIGIGGIGMSGIAQLFLKNGVKVSGSDLKESHSTNELKAKGAEIFIGHDAQNINGASLVIYSSAIKDNNPEIILAKKQGIPLIKRAEALAQLMSEKSVVAVSGSHGKTTTTSLISYLLIEAGLNPTVAVGGILRNIGTNAFFGNGKFFVAEADESDGSFLYYRPKYSIVTNIDREHLDYYTDFESELKAFRKFIDQTDKTGCVFYCKDDDNLNNLLKGYKHKKISFGLKENAEVYAKSIIFEGLSSEFDCFHKEKFVGKFSLSLGGRHNISNALSVIALGLELGLDLKFIKKALKDYKGSGRRAEIKYKDNDYLVIDDYAHHPTEIKATLSALKNLQKNRVITVFQPHRYSRTKLLLEEFKKAFDMADYLILTDIYAASEEPIEGVTGEILAELIKKNLNGKTVCFLPKNKIVEHILSIIKPGDLVATLGAGDITKLSDELAQKIKS